MPTPLPIIEHESALSADEAARLFSRVYFHWRRHLADEIPCPDGLAATMLANARQPAFNIILDASLDPGRDATSTIKAARSAYIEHGGIQRWMMNTLVPEGRTQPLVNELAARGYHRRVQNLFHVRNPTVTSLEPIALWDSLKIIPARTALGQWENLARQAAMEEGKPALAEAAILHLDDGRYDALIALAGTEAAARIGVMSTGEAGLIRHLWVAPPFRRKGVATLMLSAAMEIAARSRLGHVLATADIGCPVGKYLLPAAGFIAAGRIAWYESNDPDNGTGNFR